MGLDMYLMKEFYVKNWDHTPEERKHTITVLQGGKPRTDIDVAQIGAIIVDVAYWRKANAIHQWFIDNCADGKDDCSDVYVSRGKLQELLETCKAVLSTAKTKVGRVSNGSSFSKGKDGKLREKKHWVKGTIITNPEDCEELLPTQSGFFFGDTDYDQYYLEDIKNTMEMLEKELATETDADYYYSASW